MKVLLLLAVLTMVVLAAPPDKYAVVDRHALDTPKEMERDVSTLADYLCRRAPTDELKARVIFRWIADRIVYDLEKRTEWDANQIIKLRRGACHEYAVLYQALAEAAGLDCRYVLGDAKSRYTGKSLGPHAWNTVKLGKSWRSLDVCWAAGYVGIIKDGVLVSNGYEGYDDIWFLTPPDEFSKTHVPDAEQSGTTELRKKRLVSRYLRSAREQERKGDFKAALALVERAVSTTYMPEAFAQRGSLKLKTGDLQGAWRDCSLAISHNPRDPEPYVTRGLIREKERDLPGALNEFEKAVKLDPSHPEAVAGRRRLRSALFLVN